MKLPPSAAMSGISTVTRPAVVTDATAPSTRTHDQATRPSLNGAPSATNCHRFGLPAVIWATRMAPGMRRSTVTDATVAAATRPPAGTTNAAVPTSSGPDGSAVGAVIDRSSITLALAGSPPGAVLRIRSARSAEATRTPTSDELSTDAASVGAAAGA